MSTKRRRVRGYTGKLRPAPRQESLFDALAGGGGVSVLAALPLPPPGAEQNGAAPAAPSNHFKRDGLVLRLRDRVLEQELELGSLRAQVVYWREAATAAERLRRAGLDYA